MKIKPVYVCINIDYLISSIPKEIKDFIETIKNETSNVDLIIVSKNDRYVQFSNHEVDSYGIGNYSILQKKFNTYRLLTPKNYLHLLEKQNLVIDIYKGEDEKVFIAYCDKNPFINYSTFKEMIFIDGTEIIESVFQGYDSHIELKNELIPEIQLLITNCKYIKNK